jgi:hypothetical protein
LNINPFSPSKLSSGIKLNTILNQLVKFERKDFLLEEFISEKKFKREVIREREHCVIINNPN